MSYDTHASISNIAHIHNILSLDVVALLQPHVQQFIREHERDDPYRLTLQAHRYPDYPIPAIVEQLQARQKAKHKLPEWYATEGILFPPPLSMEQCSSQTTGQFKGSLVQGQRLVESYRRGRSRYVLPKSVV